MNGSEVFAAQHLFRSYGWEVESLSPDELRAAWKEIARRCHPDHGGSTDQMSELNVAFQVLMDAAREPKAPSAAAERAGAAQPKPMSEHPPTYTPPRAPGRFGDDDQAPPEIHDAGSGRFGSPTLTIRNHDFRDRNFIRRHFFDRAEGAREDFHVQAFDGETYVGLLIHGSRAMIPDMVKAVRTLHQFERGKDPKAVLVHPTSEHRDGPLMIWVTGPRGGVIELDPAGRSVNDSRFISRLNQVINSARGTV